MSLLQVKVVCRTASLPTSHYSLESLWVLLEVADPNWQKFRPSASAYSAGQVLRGRGNQEDKIDRRPRCWDGHLSPIEQLMSRLSHGCFFLFLFFCLWPHLRADCCRTPNYLFFAGHSARWLTMNATSCCFSGFLDSTAAVNADYLCDIKLRPYLSYRPVCWTSVRTAPK